MSSPGVKRGEDPRVGVAIPAAGSGERMGGLRKPFLDLAGRPVLRWAMAPFLDHPWVTALRIALGKEDYRAPPDWLLALSPRVQVVEGGVTRGESVGAALEALPADLDFVIVHDAARPLATREMIDRCLAVVGPGRGAVAGWPAVDTLKEVDAEGRIVGTPDRARIWHAQTPQVFPASLLLAAYRMASERNISNTDDAALVEEIGGEVVMVPGSPRNLKITQPEDLLLAELFLRLGGD